MEEEIEIWKECGEGERRIYFVSNFGRVKTITKAKKKERILKETEHDNGYLTISFCKKTICIHNLIAYAFIGKRPEGLEIDHIDRNSFNNRADNLRYVTRTENQRNRDFYRHDILTTNIKERKAIMNKEYRDNNKEVLVKKAKERRKKKYTCVCGKTLTKTNKAAHERTQKHIKFIEQKK